MHEVLNSDLLYQTKWFGNVLLLFPDNQDSVEQDVSRVLMLQIDMCRYGHLLKALLDYNLHRRVL